MLLHVCIYIYLFIIIYLCVCDVTKYIIHTLLLRRFVWQLALQDWTRMTLRFGIMFVVKQ